MAFGLCVMDISGRRKIALVIGNENYSREFWLPNARRDAKAVKDKLSQIGFAVDLVFDASKQELHRQLASFSVKAATSDVAIFYFAGHGLVYKNENFIVPVDAQLQHSNMITFEAQSLNRLVEETSARDLSLTIVDACRNIPFRYQTDDISTVRSSTPGLAPIEPSGNKLVFYSAKHGQVSFDGANGEHSPFTSALLSHLATKDLDIRLVFGHVRDTVLEKTGNKQEPHCYGLLGGRAVSLHDTTSDPGSGPSVFLSYARADRERVRGLADAFSARGWTVFWDHEIPAGKKWEQEIEAKLEEVDCVVTAWSREAIKSKWVNFEASCGKQRGILVPVTIDGTLPDAVFNSIQTEDLSSWDGTASSPALIKVARAVGRVIASNERNSSPNRHKEDQPRRNSGSSKTSGWLPSENTGATWKALAASIFCAVSFVGLYIYFTSVTAPGEPQAKASTDSGFQVSGISLHPEHSLRNFSYSLEGFGIRAKPTTSEAEKPGQSSERTTPAQETPKPQKSRPRNQGAEDLNGQFASQKESEQHNLATQRNERHVDEPRIVEDEPETIRTKTVVTEDVLDATRKILSPTEPTLVREPRIAAVANASKKHGTSDRSISFRPASNHYIVVLASEQSEETVRQVWRRYKAVAKNNPALPKDAILSDYFKPGEGTYKRAIVAKNFRREDKASAKSLIEEITAANIASKPFLIFQD